MNFLLGFYGKVPHRASKSNAPTPLDDYKAFDEALVGARPDVTALWVRDKRPWPDVPESQAINAFVAMLTDARPRLQRRLRDALRVWRAGQHQEAHWHGPRPVRYDEVSESGGDGGPRDGSDGCGRETVVDLDATGLRGLHGRERQIQARHLRRQVHVLDR